MNFANLIVTADDLGYNNAIDKASLELSQTVVNRVAIFTNFYNLSNISYLEKFINKDRIGIHFNLTSGKCLNKKIQNTSLIDKYGLFIEPKNYDSYTNIEQCLENYIQKHVNELSLTDIKEELLTQLNKYKKAIGIPSFITFHHDIDRSEIILKALYSISHLKSRVGLVENNIIGNVYYTFLSENDTLQSSIIKVKSLIKKALLRSSSLNGKIVELVIHPALNDDELKIFTIYSKQRVLEYLAWKSEEIQNIFKFGNLENNIWKFNSLSLVLEKAFND